MFLSSGEGFWPKAGGSAAPFITGGAGTHLTLQGGNYYWNDVEHRVVHVTDASGALVRTIPVASPTNSPVELVAAGQAGVYVLTRCVSTQDMICPASATETIELIRDAASDAQTLVAPAPPTRIDGIAGNGYVVIWAEGSQIQKLDATTGTITPLVQLYGGLSSRAGNLLISGDMFFAVRSGPVIERHALSNGALLQTQDLALAVGYFSVEWLAYDPYHTNLYFAGRYVFGGVAGQGQCDGPPDLYRLGLSDKGPQKIFSVVRPDRMLLEGEALYLTATDLGGTSTCPAAGPHSFVACYRL
ncbi:MAG TPA: hypothetical protein VF516_35950 [Kofleriaceae bacterium]